LSLISGYLKSDLEPDVKTLKSRLYERRHYRKYRDEINRKRRAKTALHCSCGVVFCGAGCWQTARTHVALGHEVIQGGSK
jgi:hypothetical protein